MFRLRCSFFSTALVLLVLAGCSSSKRVSVFAPGVTGNVHGGQQPVAGAAIQMYAVGTGGDGTAATPLLAAPVFTDGNGGFELTGRYSCSGASLVYVTATGGDPGIGSPNAELVMMTALGACSALTSSTHIAVNELTTVAAVSALAPFMTSQSAIGSGASDAAALASAFALAAAYVDPTTGTTPGRDVPPGRVVPAVQLNTLGNIVASCINTAGGVAGDGTPCGRLFRATTPAQAAAPVNTLAALLNLARNPYLNTAQIFALASADAPFQPQASLLPADFSVKLGVQPNPAAMAGLAYYLPFTDGQGTVVTDASGNHRDATISGPGPAAVWTPGGLIPNGQTATLPASAGLPTFGICAYFPAATATASTDYKFVSAPPSGSTNGYNLDTSYGLGTDHGSFAFFPQIGRSNGGAVTLASAGFTGNHCLEAVVGSAPFGGQKVLDRLFVDGQEMPYLQQDVTDDTLGAAELSSPIFLRASGGPGSFAAPVTLYSAWGSASRDTAEQAAARAANEMARLTERGVRFGFATSTATDSSCSVTGTSIDLGLPSYQAPSSLLNLDFPCTMHNFAVGAQYPKDMTAAFEDREAGVFHSLAQRNIAYHGGVTNGLLGLQETPENALADLLAWNALAHAQGWKTIVSTVISRCDRFGPQQLSAEMHQREFNALLLARSEFDWIAHQAAAPELGASQACADATYFVDGIHPNEAGQVFYVAAERAGFEGVYGTASTPVAGSYTQVPGDSRMVTRGTQGYAITLMDANTANFNPTARTCVQNTGSAVVTLQPSRGQAIAGVTSLDVAPGTTTCLRPVVMDPLRGGASWAVAQ